MAQIGCYGSIKVCALRVARIGDDCHFVTDDEGMTNAVTTTAIVSLRSTPEYEQGTEYIGKNGCGDIVVNVKECDRLKRVNLEMELAVRDLELLELLTGGTLFLGKDEHSDKYVGLARRAVGETCSAPVSVEVWTKAADATGACAGGASRWWRWVWPRATFTLGEVNLADGDMQVVQLSGFSEPNPNWKDGPFDDWPASTYLPENVCEAFILDAALPTPTSGTCGYNTAVVNTSQPTGVSG